MFGFSEHIFISVFSYKNSFLSTKKCLGVFSEHEVLKLKKKTTSIYIPRTIEILIWMLLSP